jgi:hypothetical protein
VSDADFTCRPGLLIFSAPAKITDGTAFWTHHGTPGLAHVAESLCRRRRKVKVMHETDDPYTVLGLTPTATQAEITHAYRTQLRALHPDTRRRATAGLTEASDADLQRVVAAYTRLRTAAHRDDPARAEPACTPSRARPVRIPIIYRRSQMPGASRPPLWAGPVREHH